jgi:hypothetical protein
VWIGEHPSRCDGKELGKSTAETQFAPINHLPWKSESR